MNLLGAILDGVLLFSAGVATLGLAGYTFALFLKHFLPPRRSWRQLVDSLSEDN